VAEVQLWYDERIDPGATWSQIIQFWAETCTAMLVVMSPAARTSAWVARELKIAVERRKLIVPLLLEDEPFSDLAHLQCGDARGGAMPSSAFVDILPHGRPRAATPVELIEPVSQKELIVVPAGRSNRTFQLEIDAEVLLAWTASTDNVGATGYDVFRGTTSSRPSMGPAGVRRPW
jgi:hypothetical protein